MESTTPSSFFLIISSSHYAQGSKVGNVPSQGIVTTLTSTSLENHLGL